MFLRLRGRWGYMVYCRKQANQFIICKNIRSKGASMSVHFLWKYIGGANAIHVQCEFPNMRSSSGIRLSITFTSLTFRFRLPRIHNCTRKVRMEKSTWLYRLLRNRGFLSAERVKCYTDFSAQSCWRCRHFLKSRYNTKVEITASIRNSGY